MSLTPIRSKTKILNPTPEGIKIAVQTLSAGGVIGIPTETVYGLAGNALNDEAIAKIFFTKSRPSFDPLIVHVSSDLNSSKKLAKAEIIDLKQMTRLQIATCDKLIANFWPGPLTIIFPKHSNISDLVTSSLSTVGIRSPAHPVAQELLKQSGLPLAAPSANIFGRISPTKSEHVLSELGEHLDYCLEGGECSVGLESTICSVNHGGEVSILRPGGVAADALSRFLGDAFMGIDTSVGLPAIAGHVPMAPGLLESHYAPKKPMLRLPQNMTDISAESISTLVADSFLKVQKVSVLSTYLLNASTHAKFFSLFTEVDFHFLAEDENDSLTGAHILFSKMRELDANRATLILCELPTSSKGLWPAIRDRLTRASKKA